MTYLILGNSTAAVGCIEGIRSLDQEGKILLFSAEPETPYSRPLISYLLEGKTDEERMQYRPADFYGTNAVEAHLDDPVVRVDRKKKTVTDKLGETYAYDKLLFAVGSVPFTPPMAGLEQVENACHFASLADARRLKALLSGGKKKVLVLGAGLIGLKCVEGIRNLAGEITVVDLAPRVLPSILDEAASARVQAHVEAQGVRFRLGDCVASFTANEATLKNSGEKLPFDVLVLAVGVRPNTRLAEEAGLSVNRGIVSDLTGKTSDESCYAAGDCAISHDLTSGTDRVLALLPNAYEGGNTCGVNMAGGRKENNQAMPMNSMGLFGLHMMTAGSYEGEAIVTDRPEQYKKLIVRDNRLVGFILVGDVARTGIYTALIREETPLDTLDFAAISKAPQLMALGRRKREDLLGTRQ